MNEQINISSEVISEFFILIRSAICDDIKLNEDDKKSVQNNLTEIYKIAKHNDIAAVIAYAIEKNKINVEDKELSDKFKKTLCLALFRYERQNYEFQNVSEIFEKSKIMFIPLKGAVIRSLYPEPWLRTSCDIDILVHKQDLDKAVELLKNELGYSFNSKSGHDISLFSPTGVNVELHYELVEDGRVNTTSDILKKAWEYTQSCAGYNCRFEFKDDLYYFYHISHMAKHVSIGGCGIKPFIDHWILNNKTEFDKESRNILLRKGGLEKFEKAVTQLCNVWFADEKQTELTFNMQNYIIYGGTYGNIDNRSSVQQIKHGGKRKYALYKIWLPYEKLRSIYPVLNKYKWLLPICEVHRWMNLIFSDRFKHAKRELYYIYSKNGTEIKKMSQFLDDLGLNN